MMTWSICHANIKAGMANRCGYFAGSNERTAKRKPLFKTVIISTRGYRFNCDAANER